jgi:hypothetical protein
VQYFDFTIETAGDEIACTQVGTSSPKGAELPGDIGSRRTQARVPPDACLFVEAATSAAECALGLRQSEAG